MRISTVNKIKALIEEGKTRNEICNELNISVETFYQKIMELNNYGINYSRTYKSNGDISYSIIKSIKEEKEEFYPNNCTLNIPNATNCIKTLIVSDVHLGSEYERLDLLNSVYDYSIEKGIHVAFNCGDFIDGVYGLEKKIKDIEKQFKHFITNYPQDKSIITFGVGGDHDASTLYNAGQDFLQCVRYNRHDIIIPNYNNIYVHLLQKDEEKGSTILLHHKTMFDVKFGDKFYIPVILNGHSHFFKTHFNTINRVLEVVVPSLSNLNDVVPCALEMDIYFDGNFIDTIIIKQLCFDDNAKCYVNSEHEFKSFCYKKPDYQNEPITHSYADKLNEGNSNNNSSQIDKFYLRYPSLKDKTKKLEKKQ